MFPFGVVNYYFTLYAEGICIVQFLKGIDTFVKKNYSFATLSKKHLNQDAYSVASRSDLPPAIEKLLLHSFRIILQLYSSSYGN